MEIPGSFAVIGLLLSAGVLARPELVRRLVHADTQLWWFLPWVSADVLDPDGAYQRVQRRLTIAAVVGFTVINLGLFAFSYGM